MDDEIIRDRLELLEHYLKLADEPSASLHLRTMEIPGDLRRFLNNAIRKSVGPHRDAIESIRKSLDTARAAGPIAQETLSDAWARCTDLSHQAQIIFRECLELIGGLALRDELKDEDYAIVWRVADELIADLASNAAMYPVPVPVPALQEGLTKAMVGVIRMRFPEWSIWMLPFAAHEYGHVLADEPRVEKLRSFVELRAERLAEAHAEEVAKSGGTEGAEDPDSVRQQGQLSTQELLADAYATYSLGPAYACAAIFMRLNPSSRLLPGTHAPDADRAQVVLRVLERMNRLYEHDKPFTEVLDQLTAHWNAMLSQAEPLAVGGGPGEGGSREIQSEAFDELVDSLWGVLESALVRGDVCYPAQPDKGWSVAKGWVSEWEDNLKTKPDFVPEVPDKGQLADVLNAAWLYRLRYPDEVSVSQAQLGAKNLCFKLLERPRAVGFGRIVQKVTLTAPGERADAKR